MNEIKPLTIEEYIIKINEEEFVVDKQTYNLLLPLGKMIEDLEKENQSLKDNWYKLKEWLVEMINEIKTNDVYDRTEYECTQIATLESTLAKVEELESRK